MSLRDLERLVHHGPTLSRKTKRKVVPTTEATAIQKRNVNIIPKADGMLTASASAAITASSKGGSDVIPSNGENPTTKAFDIQPSATRLCTEMKRGVWTDDFAPTKISEIVGNEDAVRGFVTWLASLTPEPSVATVSGTRSTPITPAVRTSETKKQHKRKHLADDDEDGDDGGTGGQADAERRHQPETGDGRALRLPIAVLRGPPGTGKSTLARVAVMERGLRPIVYNMSHMRTLDAITNLRTFLCNVADVESALEETVASTREHKRDYGAVAGSGVPSRIALVLEECDGLPRRTLEDLVLAVQEGSRKVPIMCLANRVTRQMCECFESRAEVFQFRPLTHVDLCRVADRVLECALDTLPMKVKTEWRPTPTLTKSVLPTLQPASMTSFSSFAGSAFVPSVESRLTSTTRLILSCVPGDARRAVKELQAAVEKTVAAAAESETAAIKASAVTAATTKSTTATTTTTTTTTTNSGHVAAHHGITIQKLNEMARLSPSSRRPLVKRLTNLSTVTATSVSMHNHAAPEDSEGVSREVERILNMQPSAAKLTGDVPLLEPEDVLYLCRSEETIQAIGEGLRFMFFSQRSDTRTKWNSFSFRDTRRTDEPIDKKKIKKFDPHQVDVFKALSRASEDVITASCMGTARAFGESASRRARADDPLLASTEDARSLLSVWSPLYHAKKYKEEMIASVTDSSDFKRKAHGDFSLRFPAQQLLMYQARRRARLRDISEASQALRATDIELHSTSIETLQRDILPIRLARVSPSLSV